MPKKKPTKRERAKAGARKLKTEMKKAMNTAIIAAFGFLIALVWKEVIVEYVETLTAISPVSGKLFSAILVTLIAVIGIVIVTRVFSEEN